MPQRVNHRSFVKGDPRAALAGRKGGKNRRGCGRRSPDYIKGYIAGARNARRHIHRWIQERSVSQFSLPSESPFMRASMQLHRAQLNARTSDERQAANEALSHLLRMVGAGRFDEWQASHPENGDIDDSMAANQEDGSW